MSEYTKGPLTVNPLDRDGEEHLIFAPTLSNGSRQLIASVSVGNNKYAHLFATAPELLEFVRKEMDETMCICRFGEWTTVYCTHCAAKSLVSKAIGSATHTAIGNSENTGEGGQ